MSHETAHPLAGQTVTVTTRFPLYGQVETTVEFTVEAQIDDRVLYGHTPDGLGHLVHVSEITTTPPETS
ncbi:hypothetical protein [Longimycelium tulufanense]|uniref:hypothetical protein n=1 Tax=Longimycelium tulufanense TaxID=907463 RepID=UPI00166D19D9|nr:hypothetical protein [Longimycelium tulufanense]